MEEIISIDKADVYRIMLLVFVIIGFFFAFLHAASIEMRRVSSLNKLEKDLFWIIAIATVIAVVLFLLTFGFADFHKINFPFGRFSTDMGDWGDFATCVTGIFTFISVLLAFNAFKSQQLALRRNSFDSIFVQLFAHHIKLYEKISKKDEGRIFLDYYKELEERINDGEMNDENDIHEVWGCLKNNSDKLVEYENLKNYFKYIYHEVSIIRENEESGLLTREIAKKYVLLIQAQMNNYELICYLLNQYEYYYFGQKGLVNKERQKNYYTYLRKNDFFKDLNQSSSFENVVQQLKKASRLGDSGPL